MCDPKTNSGVCSDVWRRPAPPITVSAVKPVRVLNAGPGDNKTVPFVATWQPVSSFSWSTVVKLSRKSRHWRAGMKRKRLSVCCEVSGRKNKKRKKEREKNSVAVVHADPLHFNQWPPSNPSPLPLLQQQSPDC